MNNNPKRILVLAAYRQNPGATLTEFCKMTGIQSANGVRHYLVTLTKEGVIAWSPRERGLLASKNDPRKYNSKNTCLKKAIAGRKGRGVDIHSGSKPDPEMDKRIERIVRRAKRKAKAMGGGDVVNGDHRIRLNGLRASRMG